MRKAYGVDHVSICGREGFDKTYTVVKIHTQYKAEMTMMLALDIEMDVRNETNKHKENE